MEPGESATEACLREVREETGFAGIATRLIGLYSTPRFLVDYGGTARFHVVALLFEVVGEPLSFAGSEEVTEQRFFAQADLATVKVFGFHQQRILDAFAYVQDPATWLTRFD